MNDVPHSKFPLENYITEIGSFHLYLGDAVKAGLDNDRCLSLVRLFLSASDQQRCALVDLLRAAWVQGYQVSTDDYMEEALPLR